MDKSIITIIPPENIFQISTYLPYYEDIIRWSRTCKFIKDLIYDNEYFWKQAVLTQFNQKNKYNTWKKTFEQLNYAKIHVIDCHDYNGKFTEMWTGFKKIQMMKISNDTLLIVSDNKIYKTDNAGYQESFWQDYSKELQIDCKEEMNITDIDVWGYYSNNPDLKEIIVALINGDLYTCGNNNWGQLGNTNGSKDILKKVPNFHNITKISCYCGHIAFIMNGLLYICGRNEFGELGLGDFENRDIPTLVSGLQNVSYVVCRPLRTFVIANDQLYVMGHIGKIKNMINVPTLVPTLEKVSHIDFCDEDGFICIIANDKKHIITDHVNGERKILELNKSPCEEHIIMDLNEISTNSCSHWHFGCNDKIINQDIQKNLGKKASHIPDFRQVFQISCTQKYTAVLAIK